MHAASILRLTSLIRGIEATIHAKRRFGVGIWRRRGTDGAQGLGVARVWPAQALPATNGRLWTLSTEHREIDDQRASAAWTGLPPWPLTF